MEGHDGVYSLCIIIFRVSLGHTATHRVSTCPFPCDENSDIYPVTKGGIYKISVRSDSME